MNPGQSIQRTEPRDTAQVWFDDGRVFEGAVGTPLEAFVKVAGSDPEAPTVASLIDNELRELAYRVERDIEVAPITMAHSDGFRIYRRSLAFLLITATEELFPGVSVYVDHSLTFGGYFCQVQGRDSFSEEELAQIEARMREIVLADEPILKERVPINDAISLFRARGDDDKVQFVEVWVDGFFMGFAEYRLESPEVRAAFPWLPWSLTQTAGYYYDLDTTLLTDGEHVLVIRTEDFYRSKNFIGERTFVVDNLNKRPSR